MKCVNCDLQFLNELDDNKNLICFGVSKKIETLISKGITKWLDNTLYFVDNNYPNDEVCYCNRCYKVYTPDVLLMEKITYDLLITSSADKSVADILEQIESMGLEDTTCYSIYMMESCYQKTYDNSELQNIHYKSHGMIEKKIHCCWFSGEAKPKEYLDCIDSWKRVCPDYDIVEWNSHNYDVEKNIFMKQAYSKKAWAFVSDYARLDLVYNFGGIYLDMDVELLRPLDIFLNHKAFFSFEAYKECIDLGSGFGAEKNLPFIKKLLNVYDDLEFDSSEEQYSSKKVIPQPMLLDGIFVKEGYIHNSRSQFLNGMLILSPDYIKTISDPLHDKRLLSGSEYAVHWHHAGWYTNEDLDELRMRQKNRDKILSYGWGKEN